MASLNNLTNQEVKNAKCDGKDVKLFDGGGMYLHVKANGGKWWRLKYRFAGKEKLISLGTFPEISLADARERRDKARRLLLEGVDPSTHRKQTKIEQRIQALQGSNTFEAVAVEWLDRIHKKAVVPAHYKRNEARIKQYLLPLLGKLPVTEVKPPLVLEALRRIEKTGHVETAHRVRALCGQIFRYAISTSRTQHDPVAVLRGALQPVKEKHHPALLETKQVGELLRAIDGYGGYVLTRGALQLAPLLFVRPGELRKAMWKEFDLERAEWNYTPSKNGEPVLIPLSKQAVAVLEEMNAISGHDSKYVFPSVRSKKRPMSDNTLNAALHRMGYKGEMTAHGFRAVARTFLAEKLGYPDHYIEQQLAHKVKDPLGRAYNRTKFIEQRRVMMQAWADYLDVLRNETQDENEAS